MKTNQQTTNNAAIPAELPDDTKFDLGANYDVAKLEIEDPDPKMHYYLAAKDTTGNHPQGVARLKAMGYVISEKKSPVSDLVVMEIPQWVYDKREQARHERDARNLRLAASGKGIDDPINPRSDGKHGIASGKLEK